MAECISDFEQTHFFKPQKAWELLNENKFHEKKILPLNQVEDVW